MYPHDLLPGVDLYAIMFSLGLCAALIVLRFYAQKRSVPAKAVNFYIITGVFAIFAGMFFAVFFQALYNASDTGRFAINESTGMTFLGGLIGGAAAFLAVFYLIGNKIFPEKEHKKHFSTLLELAPCAVSLAHGLGRVGCFFAGCCHGIPTESFLGMRFYGHSNKAYPTQLFEAAFLFALFAALSVMYFKRIPYTVPVYLISYGVWRFLIEFIRGDDRGAFFLKFLSPSQGLCIIMILGGIVFLWLMLKRRKA